MIPGAKNELFFFQAPNAVVELLAKNSFLYSSCHQRFFSDKSSSLFHTGDDG